MVDLLGYAFLAALGVMVAAAVSPPFRRLLKAGAALLGAKADRGADTLNAADALGVYRTKINDAAERGKGAQRVVEAAAKQVVSLKRQVDDDTKEQMRLTARIQGVLAAGDPNQNAPKYALDLERVERSLATNREQLAAAQAQYDENLRLVERYQREIHDARADVDQMGFQLEKSTAEKDLHAMTASLKNDLSLGGLAEARQRVQSQIDANRGAAQAAKELGHQDQSEDDDAELERQARAKEILERFQTAHAQI